MPEPPFHPDEPALIWLTEPGPDRQMKLTGEFTYRDRKDGRLWSVAADYTVDGASIPRFLWSTVGSPYTGDYRRASIVHDYWCKQDGKPGRLRADRMFRRAALDGGCSAKQAWLLYIGVRIGAHLPAASAAWSEPTLDYENPGLAADDAERDYLDVFRRAALVAEAHRFAPDDEDLADQIDATIEQQLSLRGRITTTSPDAPGGPARGPTPNAKEDPPPPRRRS